MFSWAFFINLIAQGETLIYQGFTLVDWWTWWIYSKHREIFKFVFIWYNKRVMFHDFQYAYFVADLGFFVIWLILYLLRRDLRKEMLIMSLLVMPFGFTQYFYFRDYWQPDYAFGMMFGLAGVEDLIWCFLVGGIAIVIYEEIFGIKYSKRHLQNHSYWMFGFSFVAVIMLFIGSMILGFNSMYVSIAIMLLFGVVILIFRHDLLKYAFFSGLLMGGLMFFFYLLFFNNVFSGIIHNWWLLKNVSGILILGVPIEEPMWGFAWGFVAGPAYEFINGLRLKKV